MDDIYFSDRKKKTDRDENTSSRRMSSNDFIDTDYFDESFELNFKKQGASHAFSQKDKFTVHLPDDDIVGNPQRDRTPQGRPVSFIGESEKNEVYKRQPAPVEREPRENPFERNISDGQSREPRNSDAYSQYHNRNVQGRVPQSRVSQPPQARTPQGARVNTQNSQKPVRMSREGVPHKAPPPPKKPPVPKKKIIALTVLAVVGVFLVALFGYGISALSGLNYDNSIKENAYVDESTLMSSDDVVNILFIGSDARSEVEGQRSDTMMLFSIDKQNKKLKLTSFLRDSYVYIPSKKYSKKLNAAFSYGGTQLVMDTLEYNYGIKIDNYLMVDFKAFRQLVDLLGGITVEGVTAAEAKYMREVVKLKGIKKGTNQMNGKKALWYCRIRYVDNDFRRTERQRKVITAIVNKALKTNPFKLISIVKQVLPNISTDISQSELMGLAVGAALRYIHYDIEQQQIPAEGTWSDARINGELVLKMDIEENAQLLKSFLYDKESEKDSE